MLLQYRAESWNEQFEVALCIHSSVFSQAVCSGVLWSVKRPKIRLSDRVLWVWLFRLWQHWRDVLVIVEPETVIK